MNGRKPLERSVHQPLPGSVAVGLVGGSELFRVNVYVRRRPDGPPFPDPFEIGAQPPRKRQYLTREQFEERYGASPDDVARVESFVEQFGLKVLDSSLAKRSITVEGAALNFTAAFAITFVHFAHPSGAYRAHQGAIQVPSDLAEIIIGVVGFDERLAAVATAAQHPGFFSLGQVADAQVAATAAAQNAAAAPLARIKHRLVTAAMKNETVPDWMRELLELYQETQRAAALAALDALDIKTPPGVARLYNFPTDADGTGQTVGVIELGGGYTQNDLDVYFNFLGIPKPVVRDVSVLGQMNRPGIVQAYDVEVGLDIQVIGGAAPGVEMVVYWAPITALGFIDAIQTAIHDRVNKPSVISASWDLSEGYWLMTPSTMDVFDSILQEAPLMGVTVCASSGDYGAYSEYHDGRVWVDYPASHPCVLSCGGTTLVSRQDTILLEYAWNTLVQFHQATGGGVSQRFPLPPWQQGANIPLSANFGQGTGRGCPDVAGNADPSTGYLVRIDGNWNIICGTSSVAPLYSALIARINQSLGVNVGYINPFIYQRAQDAFRDILFGNNPVYWAKQGWDACTGWGVADGTKLRDRLGVEGD